MYIGRHLEEAPLDMRRFDPMNIVKVAREHLATIREPRRRQVLENFIDHAAAEADGDYDALIASCSPRSQLYFNWGTGGQDNALARGPQSVDEMKSYYRGLMAMNLGAIHMEVEKLVVGSDALCFEGILHQLYPGKLVKPFFGVEVDDEDAVYQLSKRMCTFFVFDEEGKGAGEQSYIDGPIGAQHLSKVPAELVPEGFRQAASDGSPRP